MAKLYEFVVASLNVNFSDSAGSTGGASIKLEVDDRPDGLNGGETSFKPGDIVYILQFVDKNVTLQTGFPQATAGAITGAGNGDKEIDENITFSNSDTANLGYPPKGTVSFDWMGLVKVLDTKTGTVTDYSRADPEVSFSSLSIPNGQKIIGVVNCKYTAEGTAHKLTVGKQTAIDFGEVMVFSIGQVTETV